MTLQQKQEVNSVTDLPFIKHFRWSSQPYTETEWQCRESSRHKSHDDLWCYASLLYDMRSMMCGHHECCTIKTTAWLFKVHNDKSMSHINKKYKDSFFLLYSWHCDHGVCLTNNLLWTSGMMGYFDYLLSQIGLFSITALCSGWFYCNNSDST